MHKVTVSRAARALAVHALVERTPRAADARSGLLALSAAGRSLHAQVARMAFPFDRREAARFTAMLRRPEHAASPMAAR